MFRVLSSERTTFPTIPRASPGMLSSGSSPFSSSIPTSPTRPLGPGPLWPGLGWRRRRRRGSYGGGGLCREVRQRRRGESRVLWSELEGEAGGGRGWAVSLRGRGPARLAAWGRGFLAGWRGPAWRLERQAGRRGAGLRAKGPGLAGLGYPGRSPSPAGLRPPLPGPAVRPRVTALRRRFQNPAFKVIREHRDGRDF